MPRKIPKPPPPSPRRAPRTMPPVVQDLGGNGHGAPMPSPYPTRTREPGLEEAHGDGGLDDMFDQVQRPDVLEQIVLKPERNVDLVADVPTALVFPLARLRWFARLVMRPGQDVSPIEDLALLYLRGTVSQGRKGRTGVEAILTAREQRKQIREMLQQEQPL